MLHGALQNIRAQGLLLTHRLDSVSNVIVGIGANLYQLDTSMQHLDRANPLGHIGSAPRCILKASC